MLLYNWTNILEISKRKPTECMRIISMMVYNEVPRNNYDPIYWYYAQASAFVGESFLLHPDVLLYNGYKYTNKDLAFYCAIASLRAVTDYTSEGILTLDLIKSPVDPIEYLDDKTLLPVKDGIITFIYEEPQILH